MKTANNPIHTKSTAQNTTQPKVSTPNSSYGNSNAISHSFSNVGSTLQMNSSAPIQCDDFWSKPFWKSNSGTGAMGQMGEQFNPRYRTPEHTAALNAPGCPVTNENPHAAQYPLHGSYSKTGDAAIHFHRGLFNIRQRLGY